MSAARPEVLLFDLGGVLVDNVAFDRLPELLPEPIERAALIDRWIDSPSVRRFERGQMSIESFGEASVAEWSLRMSPQAFLDHFLVWPRGPYPGALEMLTALKGRFTLGVLSNCNAMHWERLSPVLEPIDHPFSSHLLGLVKPDLAIFEKAAELIDKPPGSILFLDDSVRNVEAARQAGMQAVHTPGFEAVKQVIAELPG